MGKIKYYADATEVGMPFISINEGWIPEIDLCAKDLREIYKTNND